MVITYPDPLYPDPFYPYYPTEPYTPQQPIIVKPTITKETVKEVKKKWKERHIKGVRKGILITFDDDDDPVFIATDDECFKKIMEAIKE